MMLNRVLNNSVDIGHCIVVIGTNLMGKKTFWKDVAMQSSPMSKQLRKNIN